MTRIACAVAALLIHAPLASAQDAGFGTDIPLELAAKRIVPPDYKIQLGQGVDDSAAVSWSNGADGWRKAIASAAQSAGYVATVSDNTVRIVRAGAAVERVKDEPAADKPARSESRERAPRREREARRAPRSERVERTVVEKRVIKEEVVSGGGFVLMPPREDEPVKVRAAARDGDWKEYEGKGPLRAPIAPAFAVQTGDDLHRTLQDWSEKEGWKLVWTSNYTYRLTSAAKFDGTFVDAAGELFRSLKDARPVVTAKFYEGNKTLVVGNDGADEAN